MSNFSTLDGPGQQHGIAASRTIESEPEPFTASLNWCNMESLSSVAPGSGGGNHAMELSHNIVTRNPGLLLLLKAFIRYPLGHCLD